MTSIIYDGTVFTVMADNPTCTLIKHIVLQVASGNADPMWLPATTSDGEGFSLLLAPGIGVVLVTDEDFVEMSVDMAMKAIEDGETDLGDILLNALREQQD